MFRWYLLNHQTFCFQTLYCDSSLWVRLSYKKIDLLFSRSRSPLELIRSKYDNFYCIFWITDPFATKLGLMVHYRKLECFMEKSECYIQGQGHSKMSINVCPDDIFWIAEPFTTKLVRWCIIISHIVFQKDWFAVFKVKVKNKIIKI